MPSTQAIHFRALLRGLLCCWLAPAAFLLDRLSKAWARNTLAHSGARIVLPGILQFRYVENTGAAFGLLQGRHALLSAITGVFLACLLIFLLTKGRSLPRFPRASLWLLLGGACGNLFDRLAYGHVVDFIEVLFIRFPVFNVADMCVCLAVLPLVIWLLFSKEEGSHAG